MSITKDDHRLLAFALEELEGDEQKQIAAAVAADPELQQLVDEYRELGRQLTDELGSAPTPALEAAQRRAILKHLPGEPQRHRPRTLYTLIALGAAALFALGIGGLLLFSILSQAPSTEPETASAPEILYFKKRPAAKKDYEITENSEVVFAHPEAEDSDLMRDVDKATSSTYTVKGGEGTAGSERPAGQYGYYTFQPQNSPGVSDRTITTYYDNLEQRPATAGDIVKRLQVGSHSRLVDNDFKAAWTAPFSTFSVDVDTAGYSMVRTQLNQGRLPHADSVRVEEMVNYFDYSYAPPPDEMPFAVHVEVASCPWNRRHRLARIGLKGKEIPWDKRPSSNLVFLLDVSGSMARPRKLDYVKESMKKLVAKLGESDRVSIVVYAGAAGLVLPSTAGDKQDLIVESLEQLNSGGSTAGGQGIELAYKTAGANFIEGGINRVILCTDGDFNVGLQNQNDLERLIEEKAKSGVFLSVLGFGMGNFRDNKMEALSNKGNGNYAYIDTLKEAEKVLVNQASGTLLTIAKDVKIQVNFNKYKVHAYRLIGYANRMLKKEEFHDDRKDAGDIGAGHTVTALYEIVPVGVEDVKVAVADDDKYSANPPSAEDIPEDARRELMTVRLRFKAPDAKRSKLREYPIPDKFLKCADASGDFKFAASVAAFGMLLRDSKFSGTANFNTVLELAGEGVGKDPQGCRKEFLELVKRAQTIKASMARSAADRPEAGTKTRQ